MLAFANPGLSGRTEDHSGSEAALRRCLQLGEGTWRPFAQFGAGFYFVRLHLDEDDDPPGETRGGLNFGGGVEFIMNNESAIKTELAVGHREPPVPLPDATGVSLTFGYKRYF